MKTKLILAVTIRAEWAGALTLKVKENTHTDGRLTYRMFIDGGLLSDGTDYYETDSCADAVRRMHDEQMATIRNALDYS